MARLVPLLAATAALCAAQPLPSHILMFVIDDLGFSDVGYTSVAWNTSGSFKVTPTIDSLAMSGVRLNSYYVTFLCSPSRTSLLSGRYPYTIGMNDEVIIDGHPDSMPTNIRTIGDMLLDGGWNTSAYGKWDAGMTSWGCTPMCRGFQHFSGFYNADNNYFTHIVGPGLDLHRDFEPDLANNNETGVYMTTLITSRVQEWIQSVVVANASARSFAYVAHQAIHGALTVPASYLTGECVSRVPVDQPGRQMACGMMRVVDESIANITATYAALGILNDTLIVFTTDNGGNTDTGGSNWPLRGMKGTSFEGGVRGAGFISGAGIAPAARGQAWDGIMHISDWLPTLVGGAANLSLAPAAKPKRPSEPTPPPLDGVNQWTAVTTAGVSARTEVLLNLNTKCAPGNKSPCNIPGGGAYRSGQWKLIHGHVSEYNSNVDNVTSSACVLRDGNDAVNTFPLNITAATSPPFCPTGWVPPPESGMPPIPPPDVPECKVAPCLLPYTSPYLSGGTWLFDVVADPYEQFDVAAQHPDIVASLMASLQAFNATKIPQSNSPQDPASNPKFFGDVWTPWRGHRDPAACDPNTTAVVNAVASA